MRSTKWQREKMKLNRSVLKMKYITNEMLSDKRLVTARWTCWSHFENTFD